ncbi:MAG TPA: hypothetical protein VF614_05770 [Chthoniobacteraceae bacterium]|jgi:hypothetical protein
MRYRHSPSAFTVPEVLVASAIGSAMAACLLVGAITLQRGYSAAEHQVRSQTDQMRIIDYITRDVRRATKVETQNTNRKLVLTLPELVEDVVPGVSGAPARKVLRQPTILPNGIVQYGNSPATVSYFVEGDTFIRQENTTKLAIATGRVEKFEALLELPMVKVNLTFTPKSFRFASDATRPVELATSIFVRNPMGRVQ